MHIYYGLDSHGRQERKATGEKKKGAKRWRPYMEGWEKDRI